MNRQWIDAGACVHCTEMFSIDVKGDGCGHGVADNRYVAPLIVAEIGHTGKIVGRAVHVNPERPFLKQKDQYLVVGIRPCAREHRRSSVIRTAILEFNGQIGGAVKHSSRKRNGIVIELQLQHGDIHFEHCVWADLRGGERQLVARSPGDDALGDSGYIQRNA